MKPIIRLLLFMLAVALLSQCEKDESKPESYLNYPYFEIVDTAFLYALINEGVDTNGDGKISYAEAEAVDTLICGRWHWETPNLGCEDVRVPNYGDIKSLEGIEAFKNLLFLDCSYNVLNNLHVSKNPALKILNCERNELESLDVSGCTKLIYLGCRSNKLTSLDVSNNSYLQGLTVCSNSLNSLDISNNIALETLYCQNNPLKTLDVSNNLSLKELVLTNDGLTYLNISMCKALWNISICGMPTLYEVCVWTLPFPPEGTLVHTANSPNVYFTTDCSKKD